MPGLSWCVLRGLCPRAMAGPAWGWWKQDQIYMEDPLLGPIVGKVWVGRLVVELCFRDMSRRGFRWGPWFMQDKKK